MLFLPWRRAVYIFDRYGVINNGFLCCFRGLAFFQLAFPLRLCRRSFSCAAVTTLFLWRQHPMPASPPPRQSSVVLALLVLFAFFARVSFSFFPCFSARKFPLLSYEAPKSQLSDWDCCGVLRTDEMTTVQLTAKLFLYEYYVGKWGKSGVPVTLQFVSPLSAGAFWLGAACHPDAPVSLIIY